VPIPKIILKAHFANHTSSTGGGGFQATNFALYYRMFFAIFAKIVKESIKEVWYILLKKGH